jgi:hypothetical protein
MGANSVMNISRSQVNTGAFEQSVIRFTPPSRRIVPHNAGPWVQAVTDQCERLIRLPPGWDGYRAPPVSLTNAAFAISMLASICPDTSPVPDIVPGNRGDLQAEWHIRGYDIELHVRGPNDVDAWRRSPSTSADGEDLHCRADFTVVAMWIEELIRHSDAPFTAAA